VSFCLPISESVLMRQLFRCRGFICTAHVFQGSFTCKGLTFFFLLSLPPLLHSVIHECTRTFLETRPSPDTLLYVLCSAEYYRRGHKLIGHSIVSEHFMESEGSIPNSQELSTCSYPEPDQSSSHHPIPPLQDPT
jgi:hypothetical protein